MLSSLSSKARIYLLIAALCLAIVIIDLPEIITGLVGFIMYLVSYFGVKIIGGKDEWEIIVKDRHLWGVIDKKRKGLIIYAVIMGNISTFGILLIPASLIAYLIGEFLTLFQ